MVAFLDRADRLLLGGAAAAVAAAALTRYLAVPEVLAFASAALAVALLAALVGRCVEQLGDRFGPGPTGVLQSALGNLPELFIAFFALQAGLLTVVQSALIGSILANLLLVLGAAFVVGGLRHGTQRFDSERVRSTCVLLALATGALVLPSLASYVHTPAEPYVRQLSDIVAVVLLVLFALSLPAALRSKRVPGEAVAAPESPAPGEATGGAATVQAGADAHPGTDAPTVTAAPTGTSAGTGTGARAQRRWPTWFAVALLAVTAVTAALVSDWFVHALQPAMAKLGISEAFAGLVVVAIAGNAIENFVGIQLAGRNQADLAVSVILNSPLQIALVLAPSLVLLSLLTATTLTLVFAPMLVVAVVLTVLLVALIVFDAESNWLEGATLIALYVIIATVFWWG
jgi:Ca2+:H+ antiporter